MASIHKEMTLHADPAQVWDAVRDVGAIHTRLAPDFVTDVKLEGNARIVTFANGMTAKELIVDVGDAAALSNRYGTTLRVYDPRIDAWHIQWTEPVGQTYLTMVGRAQGSDIVQLGKNAAGQVIRWGFYEITRDSFLWRGEASADGETD